MPLIWSFSVLIVGLLLGLVLAIYTGFAKNLKEYAMLLGIGGWPGRIAVVHFFVWMVVIYLSGPPASGLPLYTAIGLATIGTVATPFYINNRDMLHAIQMYSKPVSTTTEIIDASGLIPVSGTVLLEDSALPDSTAQNIDPVISPFSGTPAAAVEWAVKRKQRINRRTSYTTVDSGELAGDFCIDVGNGLVSVSPNDPTFLLFARVGLTGYEMTTNNPSASQDRINNSGILSSAFSNEMQYCETTICDGDNATVIGPVSEMHDQSAVEMHLADGATGKMFIVNTAFDRVKHIVDRYLTWVPHIGVISICLSWLYVVWIFITV